MNKSILTGIFLAVVLLLSACASAGLAAPAVLSPTEAPVSTVSPAAFPLIDDLPTLATPDPTVIVAEVVSNPEVAQLVKELGDRGIVLQPRDESKVEWLSQGPGQSYDLGPTKDREALFIHVYSSPESAQNNAAVIPRDGYGTVDWINVPHFYRCENLIVLYLGRNQAVMSALASSCGAQFAGHD